MTVNSLCLYLIVVLIVSASSWKFPDTVTPAAFGGNLSSKRKVPKLQNQSDFFCPDGCACSTQEKIIDCSSLGLRVVPSVPKEASRLYLHSNKIESIDPHFFSNLKQLTYLILSGNEISTVQTSSFKGLTSLKYLILDGNSISSLPVELFSHLHQLETVSLARNALEVLPGGLFTDNNRLTLLNLQGNRLRRIESGAFDGLTELSLLNLDDNLLDEHVFEELRGHPHLNTLRLNNNQIKFLPQLGLSLPSLKYLSLQANHLTRLSHPLMTQCGVLETLILNRNQIERVEAGVFEGCTNVLKLEMKENVIVSLPTKVFAGLTSLKNLYLHKNNISDLPSGLFEHLHSIQAIFLCYNQLSWIRSNVFTGLSSLSTIHLEWNKLMELSPANFMDLPSLETLYLHHNNISTLHPGTFINVQKLKNLDLYSNRLTSLKPGVLSVLHSLQKVQVDPLICSCDLLHLTTWSKRHHIRGLTCRAADGKVYSILNLGKLCHNSSSHKTQHKITPPHKSALPPKPPRKPQMQGPQEYQERKLHVNRFRDIPTITLPKGPAVHKTSAEKVLLKLDEIQHSIVQLQFRLSHVESLLDREMSRPQQKQVCVHKTARLEAGDRWRDGQHSCVCTEEGRVKCSMEGV